MFNYSQKKNRNTLNSPNRSGIKDNNTNMNMSNFKDTPSKNSIVNEKWENSDKYTQDLIQILQDKQMVEVLGCVHKALYPIYVLYSDSGNFICFKQFIKFMKDFEIFPNI